MTKNNSDKPACAPPPITGHTRLTGLLGRPVAHSISPLMHNEAFRQLGLDYVYLCFDVGEAELKTAVEGLKAIGVRGFNCTMPDKTAVCTLCDRLSPAAGMIGAVNTVINDGGVLTGCNTDGIGYMQAVKEAGFDIKGQTMTLFGAGGAATAIAVQAALDGVKSINLFCRRGRSWERALSLADTISRNTGCRASLYDTADTSSLKTCLDNSRILTNATFCGMAPDTDNCILKDSSLLHPGLIVSDIIYNPRTTRLMELAKEAGCETFNGLYMLLFQGAEAFRLWTDRDMPVDLIREKYFTG